MDAKDYWDIGIKVVALVAAYFWFVYRGMHQPRVNLHQAVWVLANDQERAILHVRLELENLGEVLHKVDRIRVGAYDPLHAGRIQCLRDGDGASLDELLLKDGILLGPLLEHDTEVTNEIRAREAEVFPVSLCIQHHGALRWLVVASQVTRESEMSLLERDGFRWRAFTLVDLTKEGRQGHGEKG